MKKINSIKHMLGIVMISVTVFACSKNYNSTMYTPNAVSIRNFAFSVATLSVSAGTQVTWTNNDATAHTVTADDGSFDSGNIAPGGSFSHTFTSMRTVKYHCQIHPMMKAAVVVK